MHLKRLRLKRPAQPLVFCFPEVSALCGAVVRIYSALPRAPALLCLYQGRYYLAVLCALRERSRTFLAAGEYGAYLGAAPVLYSYYAEHGRELSRNAIAELGTAFTGGESS